MLKPSTAVRGVANGADPLTVVVPSFSSSIIAQSTPLPSEMNTLTVTFVTNVNLGIGAAVVISGLLEASVDSLSLPTTVTIDGVSDHPFCDLFGNPGSGIWDSNTFSLTLIVCRIRSLVAGSEYVLRFDLKNPAMAQESPVVRISAVSEIVNIQKQEMVPAQDTLLGIENGTAPLKIVHPQFSLRNISQRWPLATQLNDIVLEISTTLDLSPPKCAIVISGLSGLQAPMANSSTVLISSENRSQPHPSFCLPDGTKGRATWNEGEAQLTLGLCENKTLRAGQRYLIHVRVRNPGEEQLSPAVSIGASCEVFNITEALMIKPGTELLGVDGGSDPLRIVVPTFQDKRIGQTSVFPLAENDLSVTITTNVNLAPRTSIVIFGLVNATAQDSDLNISVFSGSAQLCSEYGRQEAGIWNSSAWLLSVQICPGNVLRAGDTHVFVFTVTNPAKEQDSPRVGIMANSELFEIAPSEMNKSDGEVLGVVNGRHPLKVIAPRFATKVLSQTSPASGSTNDLLLRLKLNVEVAGPETVFEIRGLTGMSAGTFVLLHSLSQGISPVETLFCLSDQTVGLGTWSASAQSLQLRLCTNAILEASVEYALMIPILNPVEPQSSPDISISARGVGFNISHVAVDKPGTELLG
eukprot:924889-Rhodomonas_salina.1